jgi:hypothetical protein
MNSATMSILLHSFGDYIYVFLLGLYPEVELLGHMECVCSSCVGTASFPKCDYTSFV